MITTQDNVVNSIQRLGPTPTATSVNTELYITRKARSSSSLPIIFWSITTHILSRALSSNHKIISSVDKHNPLRSPA